MKKVHIGIDIGTTNITLLAYELGQKSVPPCVSLPNNRLITDEFYAYAQSPESIEQAVRRLLSGVGKPIASIAVTGQVHGILYYDQSGLAVSPLYTWLDQRAMQLVDGISSQDLLYEQTGVLMPAGYGLLTHFANLRMGRVPLQAVGFCGILEYITSRLVGFPLTKSDPSCLGPLGAFDPISLEFDPLVLDTVLKEDSGSFFQAAPPFSIAGYTPAKVPVAFPVGDNQAGFFGMVGDWQRSALVNLGTSGQISLCSEITQGPSSMELRPFLELGYLHVGATLTAGKAYETIEKFLLSACKLAGLEIEDEQVFECMKKATLQANRDNPLIFDTRFSGSRKDPSVRGSIQNIGLDNFTVGNFVLGAIDGIVKELHDFSRDAKEGFSAIETIVATGSSVRKNELFLHALARHFNMPVHVAHIDDGAGFGVALIGAVAAGFLTVKESRMIVRELLRT